MSKIAGFLVYAVATGHSSRNELRSAGADYVVASLGELKKRFES